MHKYTEMMDQLVRTSAAQEGVVERLGAVAEPRPLSGNDTVGLARGLGTDALVRRTHAARTSTLVPCQIS